MYLPSGIGQEPERPHRIPSRLRPMRKRAMITGMIRSVPGINEILHEHLIGAGNCPKTACCYAQETAVSSWTGI